MPPSPPRVPAVRDDPDLADLLSPTPATGHRYGYARTSTRKQRLDRQITALESTGPGGGHCDRIFSDQLSGKNADRPDLEKLMDTVLPGDTVVVTELSRLGRSLQDLITLVGQLRRKGVGFQSLKENIDTTTPGGRLIFHVFAALAEFVRELIVEGTNEGLDVARAKGVRLGRPPAMTPEQVEAATALIGKQSVASIARVLRVKRSTLYGHVPALKYGAAPAELEAGEMSDPHATIDPPKENG